MLLVGNGRERVVGIEFGDMEENELEEGEALSSGEAGIDPDVDFPYIDEKLEEVLGDIREGGVFDENMGAKLNGYGSFLPLYQRTPSFHSQTKTPPKESTRDGIRSPFKPQHEVLRVSPSSQTRMTVTNSNNKIVLGSQSVPKSGEREEKASAFNGEEESSHESKSSNGRDNNVDHKRLKVRIKVGTDNTTKKDNAAIYSGLGLVISPSSSPENSHDEHEASSPEFDGVFNETPRTILQTMTCCPIPEEHVLSPLHYSLLGLTEKGSAYFNDIKARLVQKSVSEASTNFARHVKDVEGSEAKIIKTAENNKRSAEVKKLHSKEDTTMIKKDINIVAPEEVVSNEVNTLSSAGSTGIEDRNKSPRNADLSRSKCVDNAAIVSKRSSTSNNVESRWSKEVNAIANVEDQTRTSKVEEKLDERRMSNQITESCCLLYEDSGHAMETDYFDKTSCEGYKTLNTNSNKTPKASKHKHDKRPASFIHAEENTIHEDDQLLEATKRSKVSSGLPTDCYTGEVAAPAHLSSMKKEKGSPTRSESSGKRSKSKKRHNERNRNLGEEPYNMVEGAKAEQVDDKWMTSYKYNLIDVKRENEKSNHEGLKKSESSVLAEYPMQLTAVTDVPAPDGRFTSNDQDPLDSWVQCDRCQKWRLLPSGTSTESLPSKWHCKMLNWLPGMNTCNISEDETTKALYALYSRPIPDSGTFLNGHPNTAASIVNSVDDGHSRRKNESDPQNGPRIGKKKKKHAASLPSRSTPNQSLAVKTEEISMNTGKVDSLNQASQELTTSNKVDTEGSKSIRYNSDEAAHKQLKQQTDKGDFHKESGKTLTSKSKRRVDGDGTLPFKKVKSEESCNSDSDAYGKLVLSTDDHLPAKLSHTNVQKNCSSSKFLMSKLQDDDPSSKKSIRQAFSSRELKENCDGADVQNNELSLKKRKIKQKDSHQNPIGEHVNFIEDVRGSGSRKEKKAKLSKQDGKSRSKADNRVNKLGRAAAIEVHTKKVVSGNVDDGKLHKIAHQNNASHQHGGHGISSSTKRSISNGRPSIMGPDSNNSTYLGSNEEGMTCKSVNSSSQGALDAVEKSEIAPARRSKALPSTSDSQQVTISTVKESRSMANHLDAANGVRLEMTKDPKSLDAQSAGTSNSSRDIGPSEIKAAAGTPFRKDCHPANAIFKEARELKHMANRIKTDGPELESTTMYFQAALKYLHGASLLELSNLDGDRHGELSQSLKMYSETAKLLLFCAHEYEKRKEMAAAALAYKCMEVAYFKIAYYRHPVANKDRQEWQATVLVPSLGESPSSSVSDLDNLYNGCLVDRSALVKGANSPPAAGNRAIAARSSNLMRLLDYMSETMFAFEASRKSHNAIAAANARLDKYGNDGLASVRTVLDLSFHNVQELLRLVRLSIESIHL